MNIQANQNGAATLLITVVMLILITIIVLFTSRVILNETKVEANNYRASQALMAANAGLDHGLYFFNQGGLDQHTDPDEVDFLPNGTVDYPDADNSYEVTISTDADAASVQETDAIVYFDNDDSDNPVGSARCSSKAVMDSGLVISTGYSDDGLAERTISQCLGVIPVFKGNGPEQPVVSRGLVGSMGNGRVINRFSNINVWSGSPVTYGPSAATETFVSDGSITSDEEMISTELTKTQLVSSNILGNGYDVIENDPSLANLSGDGFFHNFFSLSREGLKTISQNTDQYTAGGNVSDFVNGKSGVIYVDGDASIQE